MPHEDEPYERRHDVPEMVGVARIELATLCSQSRCATRLRYTPKENTRDAHFPRRNITGAQAGGIHTDACHQHPTTAITADRCNLTEADMPHRLTGGESIAPGGGLHQSQSPIASADTISGTPSSQRAGVSTCFYLLGPSPFPATVRVLSTPPLT